MQPGLSSASSDQGGSTRSGTLHAPWRVGTARRRMWSDRSDHPIDRVHHFGVGGPQQQSWCWSLTFRIELPLAGHILMGACGSAYVPGTGLALPGAAPLPPDEWESAKLIARKPSNERTTRCLEPTASTILVRGLAATPPKDDRRCRLEQRRRHQRDAFTHLGEPAGTPSPPTSMRTPTSKPIRHT